MIQQWQNGTPRVTIDHLDVMLQKLGVDDMGSRIALELVQEGAGRFLGCSLGGSVDEIVPRGRGDDVVVEAGGRADGLAGGGGVGYGGHPLFCYFIIFSSSGVGINV